VNDRSANAIPIKLGILIFAVALGAPTSLAAETIGTANSVHPDVSGGKSTIKTGDGVTQGEVIKSGPNGSTKIGFNDGTSLAIGSSAQVTLSHFVFNDKKSFKKATFELGKGVFRFVTGSSDKSAYEIKTPTSTISVRGTVFTVTVTDDSTTVGVESGSVNQSGSETGNEAGGPSFDPSFNPSFNPSFTPPDSHTHDGHCRERLAQLLPREQLPEC